MGERGLIAFACLRVVAHIRGEAVDLAFDGPDGRPFGDAFVGVVNVAGEAKLLVDAGLHHRHATAAPNQQDAVDLLFSGFQFQFVKRVASGLNAEVEQVGRQLFEFFPRHFNAAVFSREREGEGVFQFLGQPFLGGLGLGAEFLVGMRIGERVDAMLLLERAGEVDHQAVVPVFAAQFMVAARHENFDTLGTDGDHADIERPAAQVVHENRFSFSARLDAVRQGGGDRLVDDIEHIQPGEASGVFRGGPLRVVEVGRDGDHHVLNRGSDILLRLLDKRLQDDGRDFLGLERFAFEFEEKLVVAAHEPFHELDHALGFDLGHVFGLDANHDMLGAFEVDHRRRGRLVDVVGHNRGPVVFVDRGDRGVGGPEVNAEDFGQFRHDGLSSEWIRECSRSIACPEVIEPWGRAFVRSS